MMLFFHVSCMYMFLHTTQSLCMENNNNNQDLSCYEQAAALILAQLKQGEPSTPSHKPLTNSKGPLKGAEQKTNVCLKKVCLQEGNNSFNSREDLQRHWKEHHPQEHAKLTTYHCKSCSFTTEVRKMMKTHIKSSHLTKE